MSWSTTNLNWRRLRLEQMKEGCWDFLHSTGQGNRAIPWACIFKKKKGRMTPKPQRQFRNCKGSHSHQRPRGQGWIFLPGFKGLGHLFVSSVSQVAHSLPALGPEPLQSHKGKKPKRAMGVTQEGWALNQRGFFLSLKIQWNCLCSFWTCLGLYLPFLPSYFFLL